MAQRSPGGMVGRHERRGHPHAVRPQQRHLRDGTRAARRRGCNPTASRCRGVPRTHRRRRRKLPRRRGDAARRDQRTRRHRGLPRRVRNALRRRDRHHPVAVDRTPCGTRPRHRRPHQERRGRRGETAFRARPPEGRDQGEEDPGAAPVAPRR